MDSVIILSYYCIHEVQFYNVAPCTHIILSLVLLKDQIPEHKRRSKMIKALERIVTSCNQQQQKKFSKFLQAIAEDEVGYAHVAEELRAKFTNAGFSNLVTGKFPKVRLIVLQNS